MSELTGSQKDNTAYVLKELFDITCAKPDDQVATKLATAILSVTQCTKAIGLVPQPGPVNPSMAARILVDMAKQLRQKNVSLTCIKSVKLKWHSTLSLACMGL